MQVIFLLKRLSFVLCFLLMIPNTVYAQNEPEISASSAIVIDAYTKNILFEKNAYEKRSVASTTKIMTCLLACEKGNLNDVVTITPEMLNGCEGSLIYLEAGDEITLYDLVCGAMIASGNDAANAIAFHISSGIKEFALLMNEKAKQIGMNSTKFVTPSGLDKGNNHSTAYDMALLAQSAINNETLLEIASKKSADITINGEKQTIYNHNKLLGYSKDFTGLKTGYTEKAGRCLVTAYKYKGNIIICVTLGAPDDWEDHKTLVKYAKKCYKDISRKQSLKISVVGGESEQVLCSVEYSVKTLGEITVKRYFFPFVYAPVEKGDMLGREEIYVSNKLMKTADITANEDIKRWQTTT